MPPFNGAGVFNVYTPGNPVVTGTPISSSVANNTNSDFATGLSACVTKDGQTTITAPIKFFVGSQAAPGISMTGNTSTGFYQISPGVWGFSSVGSALLSMGSGAFAVTGSFTASGAINKVTITPPATGATLTILDGKTLTIDNTLILAGTDGTTMTFPATSASVARTDAGQTFTGNQVINGSLTVNGALAPVDFTQASSARQTVVSGPVDSSGLPTFGGSIGSTTVTASGTLIATAANGVLNRLGTIVNPSWTGLTTTGTMYLYLTLNADGTCTPGASTLAPKYQWGGQDNTSGQSTFSIQEMVMRVGTGAAANQAYQVFVGEVAVDGTPKVTAITWYAVAGRYTSAFTNTLPSSSAAVSFAHNIGTNFDLLHSVFAECTTIDNGYAVGARIELTTINNTGSNFGITPTWTASTFGFSTGNNTPAFSALPKAGGAGITLTAASWKYGVSVWRKPW